MLNENNLLFPENNDIDADHGWLTPVKGYSDQLAIRTLIKNGVVDEEFVFDILAIDFRTPAFSKQRCELLQLIPSGQSQNWKAKFAENLRKSGLAGASEALENLFDPKRTKAFHKSSVDIYMGAISSELGQKKFHSLAFSRLLNVRSAVFKGEISQNPLGQILEPGFRVIFPIIKQ